jgi:hypothetical protein
VTVQAVYCQKVGFEYMHIQERVMCDWLRERIEKPAKVSPSRILFFRPSPHHLSHLDSFFNSTRTP